MGVQNQHQHTSTQDSQYPTAMYCYRQENRAF